jgi:arabinogalactan oligomer / maltooligosaccharide transport system permease protein
MGEREAFQNQVGSGWWERLTARFRRFPLVYKEGSGFQKACLILNFILPGLGDILLGMVEVGLPILVAYIAVWVLGVYCGYQINLYQMQALDSSGARLGINVTADAGFVFYLALVIGAVFLYIASYDKGLEAVHLSAQKKKYKKLLLWVGLKKIGLGIAHYFARYKEAYQKSNALGKTMLILGFFVMGIPEMVYRQFLRGVLYLLMQAFFVFYMVIRGVGDIKGLVLLGAKTNGVFVYGIMGFVILIAFIVFYFKHLETLLEETETEIRGKTPLDFVGECRDLANDHFYVGQLVIPVLGALFFTVIPLIFMILTAFTNYSLKTVTGYANSGDTGTIVWTGFQVFQRMFRTASYLQDLVNVFAWTMIWAALATFTCYFGGLFLAMLLNKKCIKGKVIYRSLFVVAMAMPQFVSLLVVRSMFLEYGPVNNLLVNWGWVADNARIDFWGNPYYAKTLIIFINMWVGIPYYMLLLSGLLINIPKDLYEAADIEGASGWQKFHYITFPEIFYMTTPLLITSFVSNINNFNVIWFLDGGGDVVGTSSAGSTDILITWLYRLTFQSASGHPDYNLAAALGIIMFIISASISLIVFQRSRSYKNEEEFR